MDPKDTAGSFVPRFAKYAKTRKISKSEYGAGREPKDPGREED